MRVWLSVRMTCCRDKRWLNDLFFYTSLGLKGVGVAGGCYRLACWRDHRSVGDRWEGNRERGREVRRPLVPITHR
jgi:hypothetical protein